MDVGLVYFPTDYTMAPAALARLAEERGFESLFVCEHTHIPASRATRSRSRKRSRRSTGSPVRGSCSGSAPRDRVIAYGDEWFPIRVGSPEALAVLVPSAEPGEVERLVDEWAGVPGEADAA